MVASVVPVGPDKVRVGAEVVFVGRVGFALLEALAEYGQTSSRGIKRKLWNDPDAPQNRLKVLLNRVNQKLAHAGSPLRIHLDDGDIVLC